MSLHHSISIRKCIGEEHFIVTILKFVLKTQAVVGLSRVKIGETKIKITVLNSDN